MNHIGIVGATGLVGTCFLKLMEEQRLKVRHLSLFASEKNQGKIIHFQSKPYPIKVLKEGCFQDIDIVFFSAGGKISQKWAKQATKEGAVVIDNSSAFRMDPLCPLVVPEINAQSIQKSHQLIANPNCSTIQMCLPLYPLHLDFGISQVQVATYQSMSGAGARFIQQLKQETASVLQDESSFFQTAICL